MRRDSEVYNAPRNRVDDPIIQSMRLALAQLNPTVGDLVGNAERAKTAIEHAREAGADLFVSPELYLCGYPPKDLLLQEGFIEQVERCVARVAECAKGMIVVLGAPRRVTEGETRTGIANSLLVLAHGRIVDYYDKRLLPTYDVFDEDRYFVAGDRAVIIDVAGVRVGLSICEDLWRGEDVGVAERYRARRDPVVELAAAGAQLILNPSASPFALGKGRRQREVLAGQVARHNVAVAAINQVGGNDELVFDGHAAVLVPDAAGSNASRIIASGPGFREATVIVDLPSEPNRWVEIPSVPDSLLTAAEELLLWDALTLGVRDYCRKTGFSGVVLGLSGGVDSALTACLAVAALGPANVLGLSMPSRFSSEGSKTDAQALAAALGIRIESAPIEAPHVVMENLLTPLFAKLGAAGGAGVTEENVQSRLRGLILMAFSNKLGLLLLTTGNKSELGVGYCTLYGDMNGGLAVIADLTKQDVYRLSRWVNANPGPCGFARPPIPVEVLTKPPSAELRPNQTDQDSLPAYDQLDEVIARWVVHRQSVPRIIRETGFDARMVAKVVRMIDLSEYKRRQAPIGLKVTDVAFGSGRRMPIAQSWRPDRPSE